MLKGLGETVVPSRPWRSPGAAPSPAEDHRLATAEGPELHLRHRRAPEEVWPEIAGWLENEDFQSGGPSE